MDRAKYSHGRYGYVLLLILMTIIFELALHEEGWARLVTVTLQGLTLVAALNASRLGPRHLRFTILVAAFMIVAALIALVAASELGATPARILGILFSLATPAAIVRGVTLHLRAEATVTVQTMFGVLCIYLLIGLAFATGYSLIDRLADTPFFATQAVSDQPDFLYFSFATLTTVGYGDLTAGTDLGRSLAIAEALIGQIYLVTVVALIVANIGRTRGG